MLSNKELKGMELFELVDEAARRGEPKKEGEDADALRARLSGANPETKSHKHSYRKDGTCVCGAVRKPKT